MELQNLNVKTRKGTGKGTARRTRVAGEIPGILYGLSEKPLAITVNSKAFDHVLQGQMGQHAILKLDVEGNPTLGGPALVKEVQHHPVRGHVIHADFMRFKMDEKIQTFVHVTLVGRCKGVVEGGIADQMLHEVELECLPLEVPEKIELDITNLTFGDSASVADLVVPEGVTLLTDPERTVVTVHAPRVAKSKAEEDEEAAAAVDAAAAEGEEK